jgi:hypothetical protein
MPAHPNIAPSVTAPFPFRLSPRRRQKMKSVTVWLRLSERQGVAQTRREGHDSMIHARRHPGQTRR